MNARTLLVFPLIVGSAFIASGADAIAPIPLDAIGPFLSRPQVMDLGEIARSGYVVSSQDLHLSQGGSG